MRHTRSRTRRTRCRLASAARKGENKQRASHVLHDTSDDSVPRNEFPEFPAALSFVTILSPAQALTVLEGRASLLKDNIATLERELTDYGDLTRVILVETEYLRAVAAAELSWVGALIDDLRTRALTWSYEELVEAAARSLPLRCSAGHRALSPPILHPEHQGLERHWRHPPSRSLRRAYGPPASVCPD